MTVFDGRLFALLIGICMPGIVVTVRGTLRVLGGLMERAGGDRPLPRRSVLIVLSVGQSTLLIAIAAAIGILTAPRAGLSAPFFRSLAHGAAPWAAARGQLPTAALIGGVGAVAFLFLYYGVFRPRLDRGTLRALEGLRNGIGIWGRVLYGGIAEEVLSRWGLMSALAWLFSLPLGEGSYTAMWLAIVVSGILFGLGHAPSYLAAGCRRTPAFVSTMLVLNLWASLIFGWLFWQYGLLAAMVAHALFHLVWWPVDRWQYAKLQAEIPSPD